jgi:hypothetical protein
MNTALPIFIPDRSLNYKRYDGYITEVQTPGVGSADEGKPSLTSYSGIIVNTPDAYTFTAMKPTRRISNGARVIPAQVGDPCDIYLINGRVTLWVMEGINFKECGAP